MKKTTRPYLLTAAGPDKPGLVAAVSRILFDLSCNLEDSTMTRLQGEFAILLIFSAPSSLKPSALKSRLSVLAKKRNMSFSLKPMSQKEMASPAGDKSLCLVTVYGADRPGLVFHVAQALAKQKVNITDLSTHRSSPKNAEAGYILYIEGERPSGLSPEKLEGFLQAQCQNLSLKISVKPLDTSAL